jgi:uncharacterized protein (TIGR02594 family)
MTERSTDPEWLKKARTFLGVSEIPGPKHNSIIVGWRKKLGSWMQNDEDPYCGDFIAMLMQECGLPYPGNYFRARAWESYGARLQTDRLAPGAIMVFWRDSPHSTKGHVGLYVSEDPANYHILGANQPQRDKTGKLISTGTVNIIRIPKVRLTASRWPRGQPVLGSPVFRTARQFLETTGNEA